MNIVEITKDKLYLSSGLNAESFSKTNLISFLSKKNLMLHFENDKISQKEYFFSGTKSDNKGIICFEGENISGKLFSEILNCKDDKDESFYFYINIFFKALDYILENYENLPLAGASSIIIKGQSEKNTADLLFINYELFEECASHYKEQYSEIEGKYLYKGLDPKSSLLFLRAVIAYKLLTGNFPFVKEEMSKRQEDIFDENFIPLSLWTENIDKNISDCIEAALKLKISQKIIVGKRTISDSKAENKRLAILKKAEEFDSNKFMEFIKTANINLSSQDFSAKRINYSLKIEKKLSIKRFLRRNKNRLISLMAVIFIASWFISGIVRENLKLITTKGLTSAQTTHALYTSIHHSDASNLQELIKGKETKDLMVKVSAYFVNAKQRLEASPDYGVQTPAHWLFYKRESKDWIFGITDLKIDGKDYPIESDYPKRKDKPKGISSENGKELKKNDEITHTASYNLVRQAQAKIFIERITDEITLRWTGKQWKIIRVNGKSKIDSVKASTFIEDYYNLSNQGVAYAVSELKDKYDWLPEDVDIKDAAKFLYEKYGSVEAEKYLNSK